MTWRQRRLPWLPWLLVVLLYGACGGPEWSIPFPSLDRVPLSIWMSGGKDVFIAGGPLGSAGDGLLLHGDGTGFRALTTGGTDTLWWVFGLSPSDVYTVGENGTLLRYDGATLSPMASSTKATLYGIWGLSDDDLWAVGGRPDVDGVLLHKDAAGWHLVPPPANTGAYFKVWGSAANDVFVCGQSGTILHWDGSAFTAMQSGVDRTVSLFTVAGRSSSDVWAVGGTGSAVALHFDGLKWQPATDAVLADHAGLSGVAVDADGTVVLVGSNGTKLRGKPGHLVDESELVRVDADLHATAIAKGEAYAVGGNYIAPAPTLRHGVVAHYGAPISTTLR